MPTKEEDRQTTRELDITALLILGMIASIVALVVGDIAVKTWALIAMIVFVIWFFWWATNK